MNVTPLGKVAVPTPGTPVAVSTNSALQATKMLFQAVPGNTGKTYIGISGMVKSTLAGCVRVMALNSSGPSETFMLEAQEAENSIRPNAWYIDADVAGEGVLVSYWTE